MNILYDNSMNREYFFVDARLRGITCYINEKKLEFTDVLDIPLHLEKLDSYAFFDGPGSYTGIRLSWCIGATLKALYGCKIYYTLDNINFIECQQGPVYEQ